MNIHKKEEAHLKSINALMDQATDGQKIKGGGDVPLDPDFVDPSLNPENSTGLPDDNSNSSSSGNTTSGTYIHTSTG